MVYMPVEGRHREMEEEYHGPHFILEVRLNTPPVQPVDRHNAEPILVNVDRVVRCSPKLW